MTDIDITILLANTLGACMSDFTRLYNTMTEADLIATVVEVGILHCKDLCQTLSRHVVLILNLAN